VACSYLLSPDLYPEIRIRIQPVAEYRSNTDQGIKTKNYYEKISKKFIVGKFYSKTIVYVFLNPYKGLQDLQT
jgi:hypothetical protein